MGQGGIAVPRSGRRRGGFAAGGPAARRLPGGKLRARIRLPAGSRRIALVLLLGAGCGQKDSANLPAVPVRPSAARPNPRLSDREGHARMIAVLKEIADRRDEENYWIGDREVREYRQRRSDPGQQVPVELRWMILTRLAVCEGWQGNFEEATRVISEASELLPRIEETVPRERLYQFFLGAGLIWLRYGEVRNCCARHSSDSCILPLRGAGIHTDPEGSQTALRYFTEAAVRFPEHLAARWLLNVAYMTLGRYPQDVPEGLRIPPEIFQSKEEFPRFRNIAAQAGLDVFSLAGSIIVDDFDNDGWLDVVVSSWDPQVQLRYFRNNGDGTFTDRTREAGLTGILGGANLVQGDYNNDGFLDILVLRGTWLGEAGRQPMSLLRNNGDGTFTDVTFAAGLGETPYPTETAAWADFDNDGFLDLFVGNESGDGVLAPCQLFHNNGDGTFTDVARSAGVENFRFTKGVTWGDYDGDGYPDLYVANLRRGDAPGGNRLYHNNRDGTFTDVAPRLGVTGPQASYSCWFWDFDNDGALDLFVGSYSGGIEAVVAGYLGLPVPPGTEHPCLYRGDGHGGFREVSEACQVSRPAMVMGANFGDLDNDGYLDFYLGTGYPEYEALMPKVMYHNKAGRTFTDVTFSGGFGHLQKGHGVAFADFDNDGNQDVFEQMGGAFRGDGAHFALYRNPGFGNHWIKIRLVGVRSNRAAIGARLRLVVDDGGRRSIYRQVSSGGSFGANPLRQEIGLGQARSVELLEITWPASGVIQTFHDVAADQLIEVTEDRKDFRGVPLPHLK